MIAASDTAIVVDRALALILSVCALTLVLVTAFMLYYVVRYDRKRSPAPGPPPGRMAHLLDIAWTGVPAAVVLVIFWAGFTGFAFLRTPPPDALGVDVLARQWAWLFTYPNGARSGTLKVPAGRPVRLDLSSADVIHSLFIPAFRIKEDAVPGMRTHLWFTPLRTGAWDIFCTEYCGVGHSHMRSTIEVLPGEEFDAWLAANAVPGTGDGVKAKDKGRELLDAKGCLGCHALDGPPLEGPTFKGIFGKPVVVVTGGRERTLTVDEEYLHRSIADPKADVVKGFPDIMPPFQLSPEEAALVVETIKELR